ncbi:MULTISPECIES: signal peptidase I [unclassified Leptolyngbya]|uniref:signal peptidase I n=1 Tax=unclassified Leptolyngbya TaxID=2650499 RepID=UPI00168A0509|nr:MULTISPECIES: signal peptidase I [unclassified Leptolyngbya]MBD1913686.1 signal peptidase I [Leptolyngbya sp. FACHB-8]MBD2157066.1 signal peptidase I [Leptolyngbya sp. FACHB-16]
MAANPSPQTESTSTQASASKAPEAGFWRSQQENIRFLVIALALALVIRIFIAEPRFIPSDSMVPTLAVGDRLVVEKVSYRLRPPAHGDIVVFHPPAVLEELGYGQDQAFIKRIIGEPGDILEVRGGQVVLNGQPLQENYIAAPPDYILPPIHVPEGAYFVMGDNRNNSNDSHVWGFLPRPNIIGRAVFRFYPFSRLGSISLSGRNAGVDAAPSVKSEVS